ncbi:hypothetical protein Efla_004015 [Eimeria flavescens]
MSRLRLQQGYCLLFFVLLLGWLSLPKSACFALLGRSSDATPEIGCLPLPSSELQIRDTRRYIKNPPAHCGTRRRQLLPQFKAAAAAAGQRAAAQGVSAEASAASAAPAASEEMPWGGLPGTATEALAGTKAAADAVDIETAFTAVVSAVADSLASPINPASRSNCSRSIAPATNAGLSLWSADAVPTAVEAACGSFFSKVSSGFGLKSVEEAKGLVYVHRNSTGCWKLLVDRQQLQRLRGQQHKGSWSLHFLGTGAMQASATRGTSSILFSRGDGSAWLFDCGGGLSPTHSASTSRKSTPESLAAAAATAARLTSSLHRAVAVGIAAESIKQDEADASQQQQQQTRKRRLGVVQRVFITHLHGDHCLGIPAFLAQIAQDPEQGSRHVEIVGPEGLRNLLRCVLHGTSARRLPSFSVVELRGVPHLHHRRSRSVRLPTLPPAPSEVAGRPDLEPNDDGSYDVFEDAGIHVRASPIRASRTRHLVPCVGYVVAEKQSRLRLRADMLDPIIARNAQQLADVKEWPQLRGEPKAVYRLLLELEHTGGVFKFPDGTVVGPSDVFGEAQAPRKFCIAFDTCDASRLIPFARGSDILVHEATMSGVKGTSSKTEEPADPLPPVAKASKTSGETHPGASAAARAAARDLMGPHVQAASAAAFERGHASAAMAGSFAAAIAASRLILTHFSQRYRGDGALRSVLTMERVEAEARRAYEIELQFQRQPAAASPLQVTAAWDGLSIVIPQRPSRAAAKESQNCR